MVTVIDTKLPFRLGELRIESLSIRPTFLATISTTVSRKSGASRPMTLIGKLHGNCSKDSFSCMSSLMRSPTLLLEPTPLRRYSYSRQRCYSNRLHYAVIHIVASIATRTKAGRCPLSVARMSRPGFPAGHAMVRQLTTSHRG